MDQVHMGMNRTGIAMSPIDSKAMQDMAPDVIEGDGSDALLEVRAPYVADMNGLGSVPLPGSLKGALTSGLQMLKGERPELLIDKLGERLAFERTGVRLYDALIAKCELLLDDSISMTLPELRRIRHEELQHMIMLADVIAASGGDPTSQTPCADLAGVESGGLLQVLTDPRTTLTQSLHAILAGELIDRSGWETLIALADAQGMDEMVARFEAALEDEREHLGLVETWYAESMGLSYGDVEREPEMMASAPTAPGTPS